jgi:hypothetical protein
MSMNSNPAQTKSRLILISLFMVFALPLLVAWMFAVGPLEWRPQRTVNFGLLLDPPMQLQAYGVVDASGDELASAAVARDWYLVVLHTRKCLAVCRELAKSAENILLAVGQDALRVRLASISNEEDSSVLLGDKWLLPADNRFIADLGAAAVDPQLDNLLLIVDYQGYVVLVYHSSEESIGALEDLKILLKAAPS